MQHLTLV